MGQTTAPMGQKENKMKKVAIIKPNENPLFYQCLKILWENEIIPPPKTAGQYTLRTDLAIGKIAVFEKMLKPLSPDELKSFISEESYGVSDAIKAKYDLVELDNYLEKMIKKYHPNGDDSGAGKGDKKTPPPTAAKSESAPRDRLPPRPAKSELPAPLDSGDATGATTAQIDNAVLHGRNAFANDFICDIGLKTANPFAEGNDIFLISAWRAGYEDAKAKCKNRILRDAGHALPESEEEKTGAMIVGMAGGSPIDQ